MQTIYVWDDTTWCYEDEIGQYTWKSDDYYELEFPDYLDEDIIDEYVCRSAGKWCESLGIWI